MVVPMAPSMMAMRCFRMAESGCALWLVTVGLMKHGAGAIPYCQYTKCLGYAEGQLTPGRSSKAVLLSARTRCQYSARHEVWASGTSRAGQRNSVTHIHDAGLHDPVNVLHGQNIGKRVALDADYVGIAADLHASRLAGDAQKGRPIVSGGEESIAKAPASMARGSEST